MSSQSTRGGYSGYRGGYRGRGRSSGPNARPSHHYRHDRVDKPFANGSFSSKDGMSRGRGQYSHHTSPGRGSRHFNDKRTSNLEYRPKRPTPDVPNSVEAEESQMKESECFVASDAVHDDDIHLLSAHSDSNNLHQDVRRTQIDETPKKGAEDIATVHFDMSSSGKVKGECLQELTPATKTDPEEVDASGIQIAETPEKETENISPVNLDHSFSSKLKVESKQESLLPAKADMEDWTSNKKGANILARTGDETPKTGTVDIATVNFDMSSSGKVKGECLQELTPASKTDPEEVDAGRIQIAETPKKETENISPVNLDHSFSSKLKVEPKQESLLPAKADTEDWTSKKKGANILAKTGDSEHSVKDAASEPFDICLPKAGTPCLLKPSLLVTNRQKRNEDKLAKEGKKRRVLRSGMVLLKHYLSISDQVKIVKKCQELGWGPGGFYQPGYSDGGRLHLKMMCLGKNWDPETSRYGDNRTIDGAKPPIIPANFYQLVEEAIKDSHALIGRDAEAKLPGMSPDVCIVNFYSTTGKLGLHQDRDESQESLKKGLPVVSFSIGDTAEFLYGDQRDAAKPEKVELESGDVLLFGGESRHIFHGVSAIIQNTAPNVLQEQTNFRPGRLNLTFRQY